MERITYESKTQNLIEKFLLIVYTGYSVVLMLSVAWMDKNAWAAFGILTTLVICWFSYLGKWRSYEFRAKLAAIMMQSGVLIYTSQMDEFQRMLPIFVAFVVFLSLYGIADIIYTNAVLMVLFYLYQGVILKNVPFVSMAERTTTILQIVNLFFVEFIMYIWTKRSREGSNQLLSLIQELRSVQNSKDDFLANVSHEIRTPLNTICGMSEILLKEELPKKQKEQIRDIDMAGRNLMSIVRDILDFSELQSGEIELEEEAYNITSTVSDIISMAMARKGSKHIELIIDCDASLPCALYGDEKKLRRVIMNLVDNAIKFTEEGGICISIRGRKETYGINLTVSVRDTGIGMSEEDLEKLFDSFSQVDSSRKRQQDGLGLGLAISNALVQKMGGAMTMKSRPEKGTIVQFVVPQKVMNENPIAVVDHADEVNVAVYIDMEQFKSVEIRDEYAQMIRNMAAQLKSRYHVCRNFQELQRRERLESFSDVFISLAEYREHKAYFDGLSDYTRVIVVIHRSDEKYITNPKICKVYRPFYILSIVSALNGLYDVKNEKRTAKSSKFTAPEAHVLVVDDNRMNLRVIEGLLEEYKIKVTTAISGQEALDKIVSSSFDFVFMDHMMPGMDGVETLQRIRHMVGTYYQKVPIVALTANAVAGTREMLLKEGFTDFLEKPVERSVLERVLRRTLGAEQILEEEPSEEVSEDTEPVTEEDYFFVENESLEVKESLMLTGLDVDKGLLYCNGMKRYLELLAGYCVDSEDSCALACRLFEEKDWKNYTIAVHGIKGAMGSIGATHVSESARLLELAGKEGRTEYILAHHEEMIKEYRVLFEELKSNPYLEIKETDETEETGESLAVFPEISSMEFDEKLAQMEEAAYSLLEDEVIHILDALEGVSYHGKALKPLLAPVRRKAEASDCISAAELAVKVKEGLE